MRKFLSVLLIFVLSISSTLTAYSANLIPKEFTHIDEFVILEENDDIVTIKVSEGDSTVIATYDKYST